MKEANRGRCQFKQGNLEKVTAAKGNQTTIHYDSLSRKKNMNDPDMGYWQYTYDLNGNLETQTDAKNQTITFHYDPLNRITWKDYPTGIDVNYYYDQSYGQSCIEYNLIGRLSKVTDVLGEEKFCYDKLGRAIRTIKTVDSVDYLIDTTYDELGRTASIIYPYPDNETVYYDYDNGGNLTSVSNYATFSNFNALGQAGTITYANGVTTTQQYYPSNNRLLSIITNSPAQGYIQSLSYDVYDNAGNINTITDHIDGSRTQTFQYDDLNRLRFATSTVYGTLEYRYNEIGNITYNSRVGDYIYGSRPHAVLQAGTRSYSYDQNGNMITREGRTITYDYDNRATSIVGPSGTVNSIYDYSGQRVKKIGAATTIYIGKLYECIGSSCTKYIFAGSQRIASQSSSKTYFYHTDHLGSSSVITDERGYKAQETYYYPYGETRYNSGNATHYKFTGQELDDETGLYYHGARYYDPVVGRFISADSIVQSPFDPQTLNRYSYCINNPLIYIDPTGHLFGIDDLTIGLLLTSMLKEAAIGSAVGATVSAVTGGDIAMGALTGAIGGAVFGAAGAVVHGMEAAGTVASLTKAGIHAAAGVVSGGINAGITGGDIGMGMLTSGLAAGISAYAGAEYFPKNDAAQVAGRVALGGAIGGAVSAVYGGDFGTGFIQGASVALLGELLNDMASPKKENGNANSQNKHWSKEMYKAAKFSVCGVKEISFDVFEWVGKHAAMNAVPVVLEYFGLEMSLSVDAAYSAAKLISVVDHALNQTQNEIIELGDRIEYCKSRAGVEGY